MVEHMYNHSQFDHCVYYWCLDGESFIYLLLYIDDMLIASKRPMKIDKLKDHFSKTFEMKDLGNAKKILGMEIERDWKKGTVCLTQSQYLRKALTRFSLNNSTKLVVTPLASHFKLSASMCPSSDDDKRYMENILYTNVVGALMYAMVCTRPDLSHGVSIVSCYMHNPGKEH